MPESLGSLIHEISIRMRLAKAIQDFGGQPNEFTEREMLILELLHERGPLSISEVAKFFPTVALSTVSTEIMRLWRKEEWVLKGLDPCNPRSRTVALSKRGRDKLEEIKVQRQKRYAFLLKAIHATPEERKVLELVIQRAIAFIDDQLATVGEVNPEKRRA